MLRRPHQTVVRPATVARRSRDPQRGQWGSRWSLASVSQPSTGGTRPVGIDSRTTPSIASHRRKIRRADLVDHQVSEPRDQALVHERRLQPAPPRREELPEELAVDPRGVRPERASHYLASPPGDPHAAELAHVAVAELAAAADEHDPVMDVALRAPRRPIEPAGHAEVHEDLRLAGRGEQPLAVALEVAEALTLDGTRPALSATWR